MTIKNTNCHSLCFSQHIVSKCSVSCEPGEFKKTVRGQHICCYECINCTENYYSNGTGKTPLCAYCSFNFAFKLVLNSYIEIRSTGFAH